jgi:hypothetical protein
LAARSASSTDRSVRLRISFNIVGSHRLEDVRSGGMRALGEEEANRIFLFRLSQIKASSQRRYKHHTICLKVAPMNRQMELDHLAVAERAVLLGERHIQREEQMISDLDRGGHDTRQALTLLATYRKMQAEHIAHRNRILEMLQRDGNNGAILTPGHHDRTSLQEQACAAAARDAGG